MDKFKIKKYIPEISKEVSKIGIGTHQFSGEWGKEFSQDEVDYILSGCDSKGINHVDTAGSYGNHKSEKLIGNYIKKSNRDMWVISSNFSFI